MTCQVHWLTQGTMHTAPLRIANLTSIAIMTGFEVVAHVQPW